MKNKIQYGSIRVTDTRFKNSIQFMFFPYGKLRWKQVRILCGTATVKRECCLLCHWETGKADSIMISEPGDMHETCDCSNGILQSSQKSESVNTD